MHERLKKLRKTLDMTQQELAESIGVKRNTIATYESGRNEPIDAVLNLICKVHNVNRAWLTSGEGEMFNKLDQENELMQWAGKLLGSTDSFKKNFVRVLMSLDEKEWEFLERKAKELANYCDNEKKG